MTAAAPPQNPGQSRLTPPLLTPRERAVAARAFLWGVRIGCWNAVGGIGNCQAIYNAAAGQHDETRGELESAVRAEVFLLAKRVQLEIETLADRTRAD